MPVNLTAAKVIFFFVSLALVNLGTAGRIAPAGLLSLYYVLFVVMGYMVMAASYFTNGVAGA